MSGVNNHGVFACLPSYVVN